MSNLLAKILADGSDIILESFCSGSDRPDPLSEQEWGQRHELPLHLLNFLRDQSDKILTEAAAVTNMTPNKASRPAKYQYSSPLKSVATDSKQVMTRSQERRDSSGKNRKKTKLFPIKKDPPGKDSNSPSEFEGVSALPDTPRLPSLPETPQGEC